MRLIPKTILLYLLISLPLLLGAGIISYYYMKNVVREETDESLWKEKLAAELLISSAKAPGTFIIGLDSLSKVQPAAAGLTGYHFSDTLVYDRYEDELLNYRVLKSYFRNKNGNYLIIAAKPTLAEDDIVEAMLSMIEVVLLFLLLAFFVVNWLLSKLLWRPFYKTLDKLKSYDLTSPRIELDEVRTKEFRQLNEELNKMTEKLYADYLREKEFTENASHELQTPLAIIKTKTDLLMQSPVLKEEEMNLLAGIDNAVSRLSSLNKALLLLSKIENRQFKEEGTVSFTDAINKALLHYEDQIKNKGIELHFRVEKDVRLSANSSLCDILISNLLQNAIRHNSSGGTIKIVLSGDRLEVSNSGAPLKIKEGELFHRFKKGEGSADSIGLGLSIVKSICRLYNFHVSYTYRNEHAFTIKFGETKPESL